MVERVLRLPLMEDARQATRVFREVPLSGATDSGRSDGRADLLFERGGQWQLVEFKTGDAAKNRSQARGSQLASYLASAKSVVGKPVSVAVCLVHEARGTRRVRSRACR